MTDRALDSTRPLTPEWEQTLDTFAEFQRKHRGTCDATISNHLRVLRRFGAHASAGGVPIRPDEVTPQHIDEFLIGHARPLGRNYARQTSVRLRCRRPRSTALPGCPAESLATNCDACCATSCAATLAVGASTPW
jgi:hypothetical protein